MSQSHALADPRRPAPTGLLAFAERGDALLGRAVEGVAVALLLAEVMLLLGTVTARYALHVPVTWVDEVATLFFLWLGMLGTASALRRGAHMRLSFVVSAVGPRLRAGTEIGGSVVLLLLFAALLLPAARLMSDNAAIHTPDLGIPGSIGAAATVVSLGVMILTLLVRLLRQGGLPAALGGLATAVAVLNGVSVIPPLLEDAGNLNLLIFFGAGVGILIVVGVPIAFAFGAATLSYFIFTTDLPLTVIVGRVNEGLSGFILLTIPLFILLGLLIQATGMAKSMVDFLAALFGSVKGGLGYVLLAAMYLVSGISGAKAADMAAIGPVLVDEMKRRGTREGDLVAMLATSAAAAETIPPSLVLIVIGSVTGVSIASLFTGGLLPAAVSMLALAAVVFIRSRGEVRGPARPGAAVIGRLLLLALPGLALPFIIRAAVLEGIATATEVATLGVAYVVIMALVTRVRLPLARIAGLLVETVAMSGSILIIIAFAGAMSWALVQSGFAHDLAAFMTHLPGGRAGFLAVSILAFAVLGSVLEGIPAIVLFGPLLFPIARTLGVHQTQYAIVVLLSMGLGLFAPPFGYGYYAACAITKVSPDHAMANMLPYLAALAIAIWLVAAIPWISTGFLPAVPGGT